jgi:hypothetical protein
MRAAPKNRRWFWTITVRVPQLSYDRGYATSASVAMDDDAKPPYRPSSMAAFDRTCPWDRQGIAAP